MIEWDVKVDDSQIATLFDQLRERLGDMTPVMQDIGELMITSTKQRFVAGQGPDGTAWEPKSDATIAAYTARGDTPDFRPLFGPSKRLSNEISYRVGPDGTSVEWGSSLIYAAVQQFGAAKGAFGEDARGSSIPWGNIPARPFLGLSSDDESNLKAVLVEWLQSAAPGAEGN
ncbi:MAG: phage virion morphogenesis protein [Roseinatronobacter sp.]